jgi:CRISPR/Cas system-associated protein Cas10 (large subunit of type III CRISPR-Cas system)
MDEVYLAVDGDDVGHRLEYFMLTNSIDELSLFSKHFDLAIHWLQEQLQGEHEAEIIFSGGDNFLVKMQMHIGLMDHLEELRTEFSKKAQTTLSAGVGTTPRQAYFALKFAKASGKNCL